MGNGGQWASRSTGAARWADAEDKATAAEGTLAGEGGLLSTVERVGEEAGDEVAEDDLSVDDASRWAEDAAGGQSEVWGEMQVQEGQQHQACRTGGGDDRGDAEDWDEEGAAEVCVSSGAAAEGAGISDGGVGIGGGGKLVVGVGECYCWCGKRMRCMCASSAPQGAGTCDVEGCGGRVEVEEMVYVCTEHNEYACMKCVPRAARLTVDALLDECVMAEQEVEQFRQELGLNVMESGDEAPQALHHALLLEDVVESGVQLRQKGLAAASWVGGRRRATRREAELGGRERRWQEKDHQRLRMQKRERGDDTVGDHGDRSLRSRTGEAALESGIGAAGEAESDEGGNCLQSELNCPRLELDDSHIGETSADKVAGLGKRLMSGGTCPGTMSGGAGLGNRFRVGTDMSQELKMQPLQMFESAFAPNIEKTKKKAGENTMKERLEGDEGIE